MENQKIPVDHWKTVKFSNHKPVVRFFFFFRQFCFLCVMLNVAKEELQVGVKYVAHR